MKKKEQPQTDPERALKVPQVEMRSAANLVLFKGNPRKITMGQLSALKASIVEFGFLDPVVVQKSTNRVIGGHQRLKALHELCAERGIPLPRIPQVLLDVDDRTAARLNVLLNNVGGDFDNKLLSELLAQIDQEQRLTDSEIEKMGFTNDEVEKLLKLTTPPVVVDPGGTPDSFGKSVTLSLSFTDIPTRDAVRDLLKKRMETEGISSGEIVFSALGGRRV